jgi:hypothetical protein
MESRHINPDSHSWGARGHVKGISLYHSFAFHRRVRDNIHHLVPKAGHRRFGNSNAPQDKGPFFSTFPTQTGLASINHFMISRFHAQQLLNYRINFILTSSWQVLIF